MERQSIRGSRRRQLYDESLTDPEADTGVSSCHHNDWPELFLRRAGLAFLPRHVRSEGDVCAEPQLLRGNPGSTNGGGDRISEMKEECELLQGLCKFLA